MSRRWMSYEIHNSGKYEFSIILRFQKRLLIETCVEDTDWKRLKIFCSATSCRFTDDKKLTQLLFSKIIHRVSYRNLRKAFNLAHS